MAEPHPFRAAADARRHEALDRLRALVAQETPSGDVARLDALADDLTAGYRAVGADVRRVGGAAGDHLVVTWAGTDADAAPTLLIAHHDTVHPVGTLRQRPFTLDVDVARGPGTVDMKGSLVAVELAFALLADAGRAPVRPVRLVVVSDEEVGSPDGQRVIAAEAAEAGFALGLEAPLPGDRLKTGRRGVARVEVIVTGREAHSGLAAADGISAIDELVDQLTALRRAVPPPGGDPGLNVGTISGGTRANVVAGRARAELGLRFATPRTERQVFDALEALRPRRDGARVDVRRLSHRPAWPEPDPNPLADRLRTLGERIGTPFTTGVSGGAGDANLVGASGLPTVDGLGPDGGGAHAVDEYVHLSSLLARAALLALVLTEPD